jgi:hypothetical protein
LVHSRVDMTSYIREERRARRRRGVDQASSRDDPPPTVPGEFEPRARLISGLAQVLRADARGGGLSRSRGSVPAPLHHRFLRVCRGHHRRAHELPTSFSASLLGPPQVAHDLDSRLRRGFGEVHRVRTDVVPRQAPRDAGLAAMRRKWRPAGLRVRGGHRGKRRVVRTQFLGSARASGGDRLSRPPRKQFAAG